MVDDGLRSLFRRARNEFFVVQGEAARRRRRIRGMRAQALVLRHKAFEALGNGRDKSLKSSRSQAARVAGGGRLGSGETQPAVACRASSTLRF